MSVCIAAMSGKGTRSAGDTHEIIAIVDRKVSSTEFSNEDATTKSMWLPNRWLAMFAGDDISAAIPIIRCAKKRLINMENTLENISEAMEISYQDYLANLCRSRVLGRWQFKTIEDFRQRGRKQFGADEFDTLCSHIDQVRVKCTFLICGVDDKKESHILTVSHPGIAEIRDDPGYWAIGNGSFAAMSLMSFFRQSIVNSLEQTIYNVFTAKLMAETASDVGRHPFFWRINSTGWDDSLGVRLFLEIRDEWNRVGKPLIPEGMLDTIEKHLASGKIVAQESGTEK